MASLTCPRCDGDIEYEVERTSDGDGVWARSGWVGYVTYVPLVWDEALKDFRAPENEDHTHGLTACLCVWKAEEIADLDDRATERAAEGPSEP